MIFKAALIGEHSELIPSLRELLLTLLESGVQPDQEYRGSDYLTLKSIWRWPIDQATYEFFDGKTTALDGFRLPLYDELKAAKYIEDDAKFDSIFEKIPPMAWRPLLRAHPELLDGKSSVWPVQASKHSVPGKKLTEQLRLWIDANRPKATAHVYG